MESYDFVWENDGKVIILFGRTMCKVMILLGRMICKVMILFGRTMIK